MIKVKAHRDYPLNEEVDIRTEMKEEQEKIWNTPTNRIRRSATECDKRQGKSKSTTHETIRVEQFVKENKRS